MAEEGVPLADRLAVKEPVVVIGPPAKVIKSEFSVDTEVTVPIVKALRIALTTALTGKFLVTFSVLKSVAIK